MSTPFAKGFAAETPINLPTGKVPSFADTNLLIQLHHLMNCKCHVLEPMLLRVGEDR